MKATPGCGPDEGNPFSRDGRYDACQTGLALIEEGVPFIGRSTSGLFHYKFRMDDPQVDAIVADFLRYENQHSRTPILFFPDGVDVDVWVARAVENTPEPHIIRATDPKYLVHSTSRDAGERILWAGALKSLSVLAEEGEAPDWHRLQSNCLGEPPDYAFDINFGPMESARVETVPASHAAGRFVSPDDSYTPGFRLYVDAHRIIRDGLDVRLAGAIKVRRRLPLVPYLLAAISVDDVDVGKDIQSWTPRQFTERANAVFLGRMPR